MLPPGRLVCPVRPEGRVGDDPRRRRRTSVPERSSRNRTLPVLVQAAVGDHAGSCDVDPHGQIIAEVASRESSNELHAEIEPYFCFEA